MLAVAKRLGQVLAVAKRLEGRRGAVESRWNGTGRHSEEGRGTQECVRGEGASQAAPEAVRQAVEGGCQSGWGRLLSVTNAVEAGTCCRGDTGWA